MHLFSGECSTSSVLLQYQWYKDPPSGMDYSYQLFNVFAVEYCCSASPVTVFVAFNYLKQQIVMV